MKQELDNVINAMKCPICNKRMKVYPVAQVAGVVKEWTARCEQAGHTVAIYSKTREGLAIELSASQ